MSTYLRQKRSNRKNEDEPHSEVAQATTKTVPPLNHEKENLLIHENRTEFVAQDMFVPWKIKPKEFQKNESSKAPVFHRFYHLFKAGELEKILDELQNCSVVESYYDQGNWCIIVEKI